MRRSLSKTNVCRSHSRPPSHHHHRQKLRSPLANNTARYQHLDIPLSTSSFPPVNRLTSFISVLSSPARRYYQHPSMSHSENIRNKLTASFNPSYLDVLNESSQHNVPAGSETHFKVVVISTVFEGQSIINRHRSINQVLSHELSSGVHALSIIARTPQEWEKSSQRITASPACRGGMKQETTNKSTVTTKNSTRQTE